MNRKILLTVLAFAVVLLATPMVSAKPWEYPKNNDKFQEFTVALAPDWASQVYDAKLVPPVEGKVPNKIVFSWEEIMLEYTITVGANVYELGEDFEYTGFAVFTVWDPLPPPPGEFPTGSKINFDVKYMYTFLPASGIVGTISMHAIATGEALEDVVIPGVMFITSTEGTGDLRNVNIKATGGMDVGLAHNGIVSGWPE